MEANIRTEMQAPTNCITIADSITQDTRTACEWDEYKWDRWICDIDMNRNVWSFYNPYIDGDNLRMTYQSIWSKAFIAQEFNYDTATNDWPQHVCVKVRDYLILYPNNEWL